MRPLLEDKGFEVIESIYSKREINAILDALSTKNIEKAFGIREFLIDNLDIAGKVFTSRLLKIINSISPSCNQSIKSIYFDKPPHANWIVNWHQDLTINLQKKRETADFKNWRVKEKRVVVQPSVDVLESVFTIRIHLDDCTIENGALRVIEGSHQKGVIEIKEWMNDKKGVERICEVPQGGLLLMKPLILHSSRRTENQQRRRIIHIEFSNKILPNNLQWKESIIIDKLKIHHS